MKANVRSVRKQRKYSEKFKKRIAVDFESGKFSVLQLEKLHGVRNPTIYRWIYKFSTFKEKGFRIVEMKDSSNKKMRELEARIKELERAVGRKQVMIDYLEKMIEIAMDELDIDKKKLRHPTINWFRENKQKMNFSLNSLYRETGLSKQAVAQYDARQKIFDNKVAQMVLEADELREDLPVYA